jgi:hypothetical protein
MASRGEESNTVTELEFSEGKVLGCFYYTVKPIISYWNSNGATSKWDDMMLWCVTVYGPSPIDGVWTPNARWYANNSKFWFKEKKDLEWFVLRWQ